MKFVTLNSGDTISGLVDMRKVRLVGISIPVVTSGFLNVFGGYDQVSAQAYTMQDPRVSSGQLQFPTAAGSLYQPWPDGIPTPAWMRFGFSVTQAAAAVNTLGLVVVPRGASRN